MATLTSDLMAETRRYLLAGTREPVDILNGAISSAGTTTVTLTDYHATTNPYIAAGSVISMNLEDMYVRSGSGAVLTVIRGWNGSTAAASHANSSLIYVNPRFSPFSVFQALNSELYSMSSAGLFQMLTKSLTYSPAVAGYDMTSLTNVAVEDVYEVRYDETGPAKMWPVIRGYSLRRHSNTTDFASGLALILSEPAQPGNAIWVVYKSGFTQMSAVSTDVNTTSGLAVSMNDIPPLGAAMRLSAVREVQRNFNESQGDTRRGAEVPPGAQLQGTRGLATLYQRRINEELRDLNRRYPPKRTK